MFHCFGTAVMGKSSKAKSKILGALEKMAENKEVEEAVVDKGMEIAGKLVDKQLDDGEKAQQKVSEFLKKKVSIA